MKRAIDSSRGRPSCRGEGANGGSAADWRSMTMRWLGTPHSMSRSRWNEPSVMTPRHSGEDDTSPTRLRFMLT